MKVLITGGAGQLGTELSQLLAADCNVQAWDIDKLDVSAGEKTINQIINANPDLVIHCAAYTDVDGCEKNKNQAYCVNAYGTRNIAAACWECNATLVYISTDFVFDGRQTEPYIEFDQTNPLNVYGKSKLAGEKFVKNILNKYFIVRTAWLYGTTGNNFVKTMLKLAAKEKTLTIVNDQVGSPTYTKDLAEVINKLMVTKLYGTYHVANNGQCSWYQFANEIFDHSNKQIKVKPITSQKITRLAPRPSYSALNNYSLEQTLDYTMRNWKTALKDCLTRLP